MRTVLFKILYSTLVMNYLQILLRKTCLYHNKLKSIMSKCNFRLYIYFEGRQFSLILKLQYQFSSVQSLSRV